MLWENIDDDTLTPAQLIERIALQINSPAMIEKAQELRQREIACEVSEYVIEQLKERQAIQQAEPNRFYRWSHD